MSKEKSKKALHVMYGFADAFRTDEEPYAKKGAKLIQSYEDASEEKKDIMDDMMITLCGYSVHTLTKGSDDEL